MLSASGCISQQHFALRLWQVLPMMQLVRSADFRALAEQVTLYPLCDTHWASRCFLLGGQSLSF